MFKIIIAGTRSFSDYNLLKEKMDALLKNKIDKTKPKYGIEIVSGNAKGADALGEQYAGERGFSLKPFPADWKNLDVEKVLIKENKYGKYNALAGTNRNEEMAKYADALVVFWDGESTGSKDMIELGEKYNLPTRVIRY